MNRLSFGLSVFLLQAVLTAPCFCMETADGKQAATTPVVVAQSTPVAQPDATPAVEQSSAAQPIVPATPVLPNVREIVPSCFAQPADMAVYELPTSRIGQFFWGQRLHTPEFGIVRLQPTIVRVAAKTSATIAKLDGAFKRTQTAISNFPPQAHVFLFGERVYLADHGFVRMQSGMARMVEAARKELQRRSELCADVENPLAGQFNQ